MIPGSEMAVVDANAEALGVPRKQLMESSGNAVAREVRTLLDPGATVLVVAGRGNNGGDALVATRFLDDYDVRVRLLGRPETIGSEIARENWSALETAEYDARSVHDVDAVADDLAAADLAVDAMLGTGVSGALRDPEAGVAEALNDTDTPVLAVDVPSGLDTETGEFAHNAVDADRVITFHDSKPGLETTEVTVADIGIPAAAETFVGPGDLLRLDRAPRSHKGAHGEVLVVGGGPYTGAPALAGQAALRAGADLVRIACPSSVAGQVQGYSENLIVTPFDGDRLEPPVEDLAARADDHDVVVLGPGLGGADGTLEAASRLLGQLSGTVVLDADPLRVAPDTTTDAALVCTPHQGELAAMGGPRVDGWRERADAVEGFAAELDATLLVKGRYDVVSDGDRTRVNRTGNPGMTVGGTGDVLAGVTGALAARLDPADAAAVGAYVTGLAGDLARIGTGDGLVATELLARLPEALDADA
jgi:hydroxyethylthiazole kinase-like uncharacterized protein yjeF